MIARKAVSLRRPACAGDVVDNFRSPLFFLLQFARNLHAPLNLQQADRYFFLLRLMNISLTGQAPHQPGVRAFGNDDYVFLREVTIFDKKFLLAKNNKLVTCAVCVYTWKHGDSVVWYYCFQL